MKLVTDNDLPQERQPCPECGSTGGLRVSEGADFIEARRQCRCGKVFSRTFPGVDEARMDRSWNYQVDAICGRVPPGRLVT